MTPSPRPAPITAAAVLLLVVGGEALVTAVVSAGVAWWMTPEVLKSFLSFLALAVFALYLAVEFVRLGVQVLRGARDTLDTPRELVRWVARSLAFAALAATILAVLMLMKPNATRPKVKEIAAVAGALTGWANVAALLVAGRLLKKNCERYSAWRAALVQPPPDAEEGE